VPIAISGGSGGAGGGVQDVTAADTSIVVAGSAAHPTVATATLDVIAADHPPAADWSNNSKKITSVKDPTLAQDAATKNYVDTNTPGNGNLHGKGSLITATAASTPANLDPGSNGTVLKADSTQSVGLAWVPPDYPVITPVSGQWLGSQYCYGGLAAASGPALNEMVAVPILITASLTITTISVRCVTATATALFRLGIYNALSTFQPGTLVVDAGTISAATTGDKDIVINQALTPGLYWCVVVSQTALARWGCYTSFTGVALGQSTVRKTAGVTAYNLAAVAGALPASPTWTQATGVANSYVPAIGLLVT
jgi:hypothetical protein